MTRGRSAFSSSASGVSSRTLNHALDARRDGHPRTLHIARDQADANRKASLRGIPTQRGFDRDEYPPAISDEGGQGASVRYIEFRETRVPEGSWGIG